MPALMRNGGNCTQIGRGIRQGSMEKYGNESPYFDAEVLSKRYNLLKDIGCITVPLT